MSQLLLFFMENYDYCSNNKYENCYFLMPKKIKRHRNWGKVSISVGESGFFGRVRLRTKTFRTTFIGVLLPVSMPTYVANKTAIRSYERSVQSSWYFSFSLCASATFLFHLCAESESTKNCHSERESSVCVCVCAYIGSASGTCAAQVAYRQLCRKLLLPPSARPAN